MATNRKRDETPPPTMPGHRLGGTPRPRQDQGSPLARKRSEAPTMPPPAQKTSGMRPKRRTPSSSSHAATVDEVVADLSNDPRREEEDE
jgi:hypothetical protein